MPHYNLTIAAPTGSADTVIFDTTVHFGGGGMIPLMGVERIAFTAEHDQAGTLKAYRSTNKGTTWDLYDERAVAVSSGTEISGPFDYVVNTYQDWKLVWTNGGVNQGAAWRPEISFTEEMWP